MFHCALSCLFGLCGDYDNGVFVFFSFVVYILLARRWEVICDIRKDIEQAIKNGRS